MTVTGLVPGDEISSVELKTSDTGVTDSGTITVQKVSVRNAAGADVSANYAFTFIPGKLVIEETPVPGTDVRKENPGYAAGISGEVQEQLNRRMQELDDALQPVLDQLAEEMAEKQSGSQADARQKLADAGISVSGPVRTVEQYRIVKEITAVQTDGDSPVLEIHITPESRTVYTCASAEETLVLAGEEGTANAVLQDADWQPMNVSGKTVQMAIPVPNAFVCAAEGKTLQVQHSIRDGVKIYEARLTGDDTAGWTVQFTNPDGFSVFRITTDPAEPSEPDRPSEPQKLDSRPDTPHTGDNFRLPVFWMLLAAASGICLILLGKKALCNVK